MRLPSGKHSDRQMTEKSDAARFIAKLVAKRRTSLDEIPGLIENVQRALANLGASEAATSPPVAKKPRAAPRPMPAQRKASRAKKQMESEPIAVAPAEPQPKPTQPTLLRRADVISVARVEPAPAFAPLPQGAVRGVVQWFDSRSGQGTLRLPGLAHDLPIDAAMLAGFGITRLFKGQEIEAELDRGGDAPRIVGLHLTNAPAASPISGGTVRDRHAKPVVVELKREAISRSAARAEAELALRPRRAR